MFNIWQTAVAVKHIFNCTSHTLYMTPTTPFFMLLAMNIMSLQDTPRSAALILYNAEWHGGCMDLWGEVTTATHLGTKMMYGNRPLKKCNFCAGNAYVDVKHVGDKLINDRR